jgi:hypothetical protein
MKRFRYISLVVLAFALGAASTALAQTPLKLVVSEDDFGTLYLVTDHGRFTLNPVYMSPGELDASVDLGPLSGAEVGAQVPTGTPVPPTSTPVPPTSTPIPATAQPITLSGSTGTNSTPLHLAGNYTSNWSVSGAKLCSGSAKIVAVDGHFIRNNEVIPLGFYDQPASGQTQVYGLTDGQYYVSTNINCNWAINLSPL